MTSSWYTACEGMGLLPDTWNCGLRMFRECRERYPRQRLQKKPLVSDPSMHHGTCDTHVPCCMSGSLNRGGGENFPDIPSARTTRNLTYLARGPLTWNGISVQGTDFTWKSSSLRAGQMAAVLQMTFFKFIFLGENYFILIRISIFPNGSISRDNSTFVQIMTWCQIGEKPLSEPRMA